MQTIRRQAAIAAAAALLSLCAAGCKVNVDRGAKHHPIQATAEDLQQVEAESIRVIFELDNGRYGEVWDQSAPYLKQSIDRPGFERTLQMAKKLVGPRGARTRGEPVFEADPPGLPRGRYAAYANGIECGKEACIEKIVLQQQQPGGDWKLAGYHVNKKIDLLR